MPRWRSWLSLLIVLLLCAPAAWPFFQPELARTNDTLPHLYRAIQLDALVGAGAFFPRWAPDLVFGYGYPVFNFFPYLAHYLIVAAHRLGLDFVAAYQAAGAFTLALSAGAAWALGRELDGEAAGLAAGVAYAYSPYLLYDAHIRGSLPESLALALLPLALLFLRRAARGQAAAGGWAGLAIAGCLLAHNGVSLQAMPFLLAYALFEVWLMMKELGVTDWKASLTPNISLVKRLAPALLPFLLAALLSAFFWLPALAEASLIQIERGTTNGGMLYTDNFLSWFELTALPRAPVDPDLLNPPVVRALPLAALVLAALAAMRALMTPGAALSRARLLFWLAAAAGATVLIHPVSQPLWEAVPLLRLTLFPWRLLGPGALFLALAAGALFAPSPHAAASLRPGARSLAPGRWPLPLALCLLILAGLPWASPPREPTPAAPGLEALAAFENPPVFIGTTTVGEYLPRTVQALPADSAARRDRAARARFAAPGAEVAHAAAGPFQDVFSLNAPAPLTFTYNQFYFPGWQAVLDGAPVTPRVTEPDGLMAVAVPAGTHTLTFTFGDTWPRTAGNTLALIGLLAAALAFLPWPGSLKPAGGVRRASPLTRESAAWGIRDLALVFAVAVALLFARPFLWDAGRTPFLQPGLTEAGLRGLAQPLNQDFSGELTLLGWEAPRPAAGDQPVPVTLYWRANHRLGVPYGFDVRLVDAAGQTWSEPGPRRPRDWRFIPGTDFWPADQYVLDAYQLTPLAGAPAGEYQVRVTVFSLYDFRTIGQARLGPVALTSASRRACAPDPLADLDAVILQGVAFRPTQAAPGDDVTADLCWAAARPAPALNTARLVLKDQAGRAVLTQPLAVDTARWRAGDVVRFQLPVRLPAGLETGTYHWVLAQATAALELGSLAVTAPERVFSPPALGHALQAGLGPVTLAAADAPAALVRGAPLAVTLVWRADAPLPDSYHVFVHLTGADGLVYAQSDGLPAAGARRTSGWLPGEYVVETRTLEVPADLPAGTYALFAGLYQPETGERLSTPAFPDGRVAVGSAAMP